MDGDLLSIGRFARLAGLSVGALRHYDELLEKPDRRPRDAARLRVRATPAVPPHPFLPNIP